MVDWLRDHVDGIVLGGFLSALAVFFSKLILVTEQANKAYAWLKMFFGGANRVIETLERHGQLLQTIQAEVTPNGGGSLKDLVRKTYEVSLIADLRAKQVLAIAPIGIYNCDIFGNCIWANEALCSTFGLDHSDMLGNGWLLAVAPEQRSEVHANWIKSVQNHLPYSWEYDAVNQRTGERFRCKSSAEACKRPDTGEPLFYHGTVERLTPQ